MESEELRIWLEKSNPHVQNRKITVFPKSRHFKISGRTIDYKFVLSCMFPIDKVQDTLEWRQYFQNR